MCLSGYTPHTVHLPTPIKNAYPSDFRKDMAGKDLDGLVRGKLPFKITIGMELTIHL